MDRARNTSPIDAGGHPIWAGPKALSILATHLPEWGGRAIVLGDTHTLQFCLPELLAHVPALADVPTLEMPVGEQAKSLAVCADLWTQLHDLEADRHTVLICLGGGVVCDVGGFVAGAYKRGVRCVHLPTTLMAMADAAIGGKTAIDLHGVKNIVGLFHDPLGVYLHTPFLRTLGKRELLNGVAEMLKHVVVADADHWKAVSTAPLHDLDALAPLVERSATIKASIVKTDPREKGARRLLNFGHTIGHAVEAASWEGAGRSLLHGEAVVVGMITAAWIACRMELLDEVGLEAITSPLCTLYGLASLEGMDNERLLTLMRNDKKNRNGAFHFTLPERIGRARAGVRVQAHLVLEALAHYRELYARYTTPIPGQRERS